MNAMDARSEHALLMDRIYRYQRRFGIYDATRKYYLLGRDPMIASLAPPAGGTVLEIGCGTGTTTLAIAERVGGGGEILAADISHPMLQKAIARAATIPEHPITFVEADDQVHQFPQAHFDGGGELDQLGPRHGPDRLLRRLCSAPGRAQPAGGL